MHYYDDENYTKESKELATFRQQEEIKSKLRREERTQMEREERERAKVIGEIADKAAKRFRRIKLLCLPLFSLVSSLLAIYLHYHLVSFMEYMWDIEETTRELTVGAGVLSAATFAGSIVMVNEWFRGRY